jgi:hypothetical protein
MSRDSTTDFVPQVRREGEHRATPPLRWRPRHQYDAIDAVACYAIAGALLVGSASLRDLLPEVAQNLNSPAALLERQSAQERS